MAKLMVFFDCWDTLIRFKTKDERWTFLPLRDHALNRDQVDWDKVAAFAKRYEELYYSSHSRYETSSLAYCRLLVTLFHIRLDCPLSFAASQIRDYLDPSPVEGIEDFLTFLEKKAVPYACLSNTIYTEEDTRKAITRHIPAHHLSFVLASSEIGVKKPNPDFFLAGLSRADVTPENAVYIGDSFLQDVYGSFNAGFSKSYWLNHKHASPFFLPEFPGRRTRKYREASGYRQIQADLEERLNHD